MNHTKFLSILAPLAMFSLLTFSVAPALADYPTGCAALQTCVDSGVVATLSDCQTANPTCDVTQFTANKSTERFAASSGQIATRAVELRNCSTKTTKQACNACYRAAKRPLQNRFFGRLFHGLLGNAVLLIEEARKSTCLSLPNNSASGK